MLKSNLLSYTLKHTFKHPQIILIIILFIKQPRVIMLALSLHEFNLSSITSNPLASILIKAKQKSKHTCIQANIPRTKMRRPLTWTPACFPLSLPASFPWWPFKVDVSDSTFFFFALLLLFLIKNLRVFHQPWRELTSCLFIGHEKWYTCHFILRVVIYPYLD